MSQAPCTLFWPRSGFTPAPGRPTFPVSRARLAQPITPSEPSWCSVTPRPYRSRARSAWAYSRAAASSSAAATPVMAATRSGGYSRTFSAKASNCSPRAAMKSASCRRSRIITCARPFSRATLVPGRRASQWSATRASSVQRGSTTTSRVPFLNTARRTRMPITGWASVGLQPTSRSTAVSSMSSRGFVAAPPPKTADRPVTDGLWQTRGAVVDVVRAYHGPHELLEQVAFFIRAPAGRNSHDGRGAGLVANGRQSLGHQPQGLVPRRLAEAGEARAAGRVLDERLGEPVGVVHKIMSETAFHAQQAAVGQGSPDRRVRRPRWLPRTPRWIPQPVPQ